MKKHTHTERERERKWEIKREQMILVKKSFERTNTFGVLMNISLILFHLLVIIFSLSTMIKYDHAGTASGLTFLKTQNESLQIKSP